MTLPMTLTRPLGSALAFGLFLAACSGNPSPSLGPVNGDLAPCPGTPNCVHTGHGSPEGTPAWVLDPVWAAHAQEDASSLLDILEEGVHTLPRTRVIRRDSALDGDHYLHAEATSRIFRFVDDVELLLKPQEGVVIVRSASRVGHSDLGVNADRVESLRRYFQARAILLP